MMRLEAEGICVRYGKKRIVEGLSLSLPEGSVTGLIGPNGAGKSTFLKALAGLVPFEGRVRLAGRSIASFPARERARFAGYLPQERSVYWPLEARKVVELGRIPYLGPWQAPGRADLAVVDASMEETSTSGLAARRFDTLSGGEKALVLIARVVAGEPSVILADEPAAGLDLHHELQVFELFRKRASAGTSVLLVLHDLNAAAKFCDRLLLLDRGRMAASGTPAEVLTPENLRKIYAVDADVMNVGGAPHVRLRGRI